jgi:hypothetical protein
MGSSSSILRRSSNCRMHADDESRKNPLACRGTAPPDHPECPRSVPPSAQVVPPAGRPAASPRDIPARGGSRPWRRCSSTSGTLAQIAVRCEPMAGRSPAARPHSATRGPAPCRILREAPGTLLPPVRDALPSPRPSPGRRPARNVLESPTGSRARGDTAARRWARCRPPSCGA